MAARNAAWSRMSTGGNPKPDRVPGRALDHGTPVPQIRSGCSCPLATALLLAASPPAAGRPRPTCSPPPRGARPAEARFLRARAALAAGDAAAASRDLAGLAPLLPAIADRVEALSAAAFEAQGDRTGPSRPGGGSRRESLLWPQARVSIARLLAASGKGAEAVEALRPLLAIPAPGDLSRGDPAPRAAPRGGTILADQPGGAPEARRIFLDCWAGHALSGGGQGVPHPPGGAAPARRRTPRRRGRGPQGRGAARLEPQRAGPRGGPEGRGSAAAPGGRRAALLPGGLRPGEGAPQAAPVRRRGRRARARGRGLHRSRPCGPGRSTCSRWPGRT